MNGAPKRRRTFRANTKFYVFVALVAVALVGGWYIFFSRDTVTVQQGTIDFSTNVPVVVVRDEEVVAAETYGRAVFLIPDQQRVEAQTPVVELYKWGYNDNVMSDLVDVRTKILQYESSIAGSSSELTSLNDAIADTTKQIRAAAEQNGEEEGDVAVLESQLIRQIEDRTRYLRETVASDQQLNDYHKQEQQLEERVASWRDVWTSPEAGVVSYYYDGYEPLLNADNIREASASQVRSILAGTLPIAQMADGTEPLYRLVNNFQWYIVIPSEEPVLEFANDNVFQVVFDDYPDRRFEGTIIGHIAEGSDHLYVMEFSEDIGALVNTRRAEARISASFTGFSVPSGAVQYMNGQTGVYVVQQDARVFVPVTVRAEEDGSSIVLPLETSSPLAAGTKVAA